MKVFGFEILHEAKSTGEGYEVVLILGVEFRSMTKQFDVRSMGT